MVFSGKSQTSGYLLLALPGLLLFATNAPAGVYGDDVEEQYWDGEGATRDNHDIGGLVGSYHWDGSSENNQLSLSWDIQQKNDGWMYTYTWDGTEKALDRISHFDLDITDDAFDDPNAITGASTEWVDLQATEPGGSPEGYDNLGVKFDNSGPVYSFFSNRGPVWGDLCLKDGVGEGGGEGSASDTCGELMDVDEDGFYEPGEYAGNTTLLWNVGFGNEESQDINYYIARPNAVDGGNGDNGGNGNQIPAPGILALLAVGSLGASLSLRRKGNG